MNKFVILALLVSMFLSTGCIIRKGGNGGCEFTTVEQEVNSLKEGDDILVVVGTKVCPACVTLKHKLQTGADIRNAISKQFGDRFYVLDGNSATHAKIVDELKVTAYPTVIRFKFHKGVAVEVDRFVGADLSKEKLKAFVEKDYDLSK